MSPPSIHPLHPMPGYVPGHPHPRMYYAPYMAYTRPYMRFPPPSRPRFFNSEIYSSDYQPTKERLIFD